MKSHFLKKNFNRNQSTAQWKAGRKKNHKIALSTQLALELTGTLPREANAQSINGNVNA